MILVIVDMGQNVFTCC